MNTKKIQFSGLLSVGQAPTSEANDFVEQCDDLCDDVDAAADPDRLEFLSPPAPARTRPRPSDAAVMHTCAHRQRQAVAQTRARMKEGRKTDRQTDSSRALLREERTVTQLVEALAGAALRPPSLSIFLPTFFQLKLHLSKNRCIGAACE